MTAVAGTPGRSVRARAAKEADPAKPAAKPSREQDPRNPLTRLARLFDAGTVELLTPFDDSGFVAAQGLIDGTRACAYASDPTVQGGAMGDVGCKAILLAYEKALAEDVPVIGLLHSGGARLAEGVLSLHAAGQVFAMQTRASGKIPQISLVLGPAGRVFVTGPEVVRSATGEAIDLDRLGGPEPHGRRSGVVHVVAHSEEEAFASTRRLASLLGDQGTMDLGSIAERDLAALLPESPKRAYDVHPLVNGVLDGSGVELHPKWAPNIVTTLGRFGGRTIGVIANNPLRLGGCLDSASAEKAARFVRMCDALGVPLVVLVDVPGYLPGVGQEWDGVARRGAKLLHAFAEAVVPRVTLVTRKGYGGAYIAMNSRALGATRVFAWPTAQVAVMGAVAAVRVLHRRQLAEATEDLRPQLEIELAAEHTRAAGGLEKAVAIGVVDEVVDPAATRRALAAALADAPQRRGQHGNIPL